MSDPGIPASLRLALDIEVAAYERCGVVTADVFESSAMLATDRWIRDLDEGDDEMYALAVAYAHEAAARMAADGMDLQVEP